MLSLQSLINPLVISLTMILCTQVWAEPQHRPGGGLPQILKQLDLDEHQRQNIRLLLKQNRDDKSLYGEDVKNHYQDLRSLIQSASWNQTAVKTALEIRQEANNEHRWQNIQSKHQIWLALTPPQQQQFIQLLVQQDDKKGGKRHLQKRLRKLDLTEQQWAQVEINRAKMKTHLSEHKAARQKFRQSLAELIGADELSYDDWQLMQKNHQQDWLTHAMFKAENEHALWLLLTPEQQSKWQLMQERTELKMHKHKSKQHSIH